MSSYNQSKISFYYRQIVTITSKSYKLQLHKYILLEIRDKV